jgi:hypothetical protein
MVDLSYGQWISAVSNHVMAEVSPRCCGTCSKFRMKERCVHPAGNRSGNLCEFYDGPGRMEATTRGRHKMIDSLQRRARRMLECMHHVKGHICDDCGRPAEKNGQIHGRDRGSTCHARVCPRCARRRSAQVKAWAERLKGVVVEKDTWCRAHGLNYRLRFVTLTDRYDPSSDDDLSVSALRRRWDGLRSAWSEILDRVRRVEKLRDIHDFTFDEEKDRWRRRKNPIRAAVQREHTAAIGAWSAVELSGVGHAHLHVLYFGPWVDLQPWTSEAGPEPGWTTIGRRAYSRLGDVADVELADFDSIPEIAKYPMKMLGANNKAAGWLAGESLTTEDGRPGLMNPELAARWEIALFGARIGDRYGSFRAIPAPEDEKITERSIRPTHVCEHCGADAWKLVSWPIPDWVRICKLADVQPFGRPAPVAEHHGGDDDGRETRRESKDYGQAIGAW